MFAAVNSALILALLALLKRGVSLDLLANAFLMVSLPLLVGVTALSGGELPLFLYGAAMVPLAALLLTPPRAAVFWTALTCFLLLSAGLLEASGVAFPREIAPHASESAKYFTAMILVLSVFGVTWVFESSRRQADAENAAASAHAAELQEALAATEKRIVLHELNRLERMAGGVAHDFNNILTAVVGNAELIEASSDDVELADFVREIRDAVDHGTHLTAQLLHFTGRSRRDSEPIELWEIVRKAAAGSPRPIALSAPDGSCFTIGDESLLHSALAGIIRNAIEALPDHAGEVTIHGRRRELDAAELQGFMLGERCTAGPFVSIEIRDNGRGIEAVSLAQVFDPFYSTKSPGRGLGMSAVLGIVRTHGGALKLSSQLGSGTSIELLFPLAPAPQRACPPLRVPRREPAARPRALVVDDECAVRRVATRLLEARGFDVTPARDGEQALLLFRQQPDQDLVLIDFSMPGLNGAEVAGELRGLDPACRILLMSGYADQEVALRDPTGLFDGFVEKPFGAKALMAAVDAALGP